MRAPCSEDRVLIATPEDALLAFGSGGVDVVRLRFAVFDGADAMLQGGAGQVLAVAEAMGSGRAVARVSATSGWSGSRSALSGGGVRQQVLLENLPAWGRAIEPPHSRPGAHSEHTLGTYSGRTCEARSRGAHSKHTQGTHLGR